MARQSKSVFLSSVAAGLQPMRDAAFQAIRGLDDCRCVRMEDFGSRADPPVDVCCEAIRNSDVFIGLVGHRYGSLLPNRKISYTELEYRLAVRRGIPALMFMAQTEFPVPANLIESDELRRRQAMFRRRVGRRTHLAYFDSHGDLAIKVIQAIHNLDSVSRSDTEVVSEHTDTSATSPLSRDSAVPMDETYEHARPSITRLLFPYVTNQVGFDSGISIANATSDPFGSEKQWGHCTIHYFGVMPDGRPVPNPQTTDVVPSGGSVAFLLSQGGVSGAHESAAGFQGYIIAECHFGRARGFAFVSDVRGERVAAGYLAEVLPLKEEYKEG